MKWEKYRPKEIPEGYRLTERKCFKCDGTKYFGGKYGQTACEECSNGVVFRLIKMRKKKE